MPGSTSTSVSFRPPIFFEPCYETGKAVRWRIEQAQGRPLGIGGIWEWKADGPDGLPLLSFSMLTINADKHPLMKRFHKPREEKRMPVILEPQQYHDWLEGALQNDAAAFAPYPADQLVAVADPLPPTLHEEFTICRLTHAGQLIVENPCRVCSASSVSCVAHCGGDELRQSFVTVRHRVRQSSSREGEKSARIVTVIACWRCARFCAMPALIVSHSLWHGTVHAL
ncbi:SOS response-associated peptidase family protein [Undibacterium arcticum]